MSLAEARADLVATLSDTGYKVHGYATPKIVSGIVVINEADPFIRYGDVLSRPELMVVNFEVWLWHDLRNEKTATMALDEMVANVVTNLGEWTLTNLVSHRRTVLVENGPQWLTSTLSVSNITNILGGN